jgi:aspartyl-tRNA(Asn)/glutamyl-tRNA(Gln) amidotransferase subunit A
MINATLAQLAAGLSSGRITSRALVEDSLARIADPASEGARAFITIDAEGARLAADYQDALRKRGQPPSPFAGIPMSVKDLFDMAGQVTTAGSVVLKGAAPATADAPAIARLRAAGFIALGRTNMTEFAYSGVGINTHYGTPRAPYDRATGRIPGGSTAGGAVSVADGMCALAIGSDTGGSCRIPAAYCGIVGYKPSHGRIPLTGAFPLAPSLDSIGPLANSVACCAATDALMAGDWDGVLPHRDVASLRLGVLRDFVLDGLEAAVAADFEHALHALEAAGARLADVRFPALNELPAINRSGGIGGAEAHHTHRARLESEADRYDPRVRPRLLLAAAVTADDYLTAWDRRREMIASFATLAQGFDALVLPAVMNVPPPIAELDGEKDYLRLNAMALRNTAVGNFLNSCAISLPMHRRGAAPTGFMLMAPWGQDRALFAAAATAEGVLGRGVRGK